MNANSEDFSIEKLICEESFQQYCLGYDIKSQIYWEDWIKAHPHKLDDFIEAKRIFYILNAKQGNRLEQLHQLREGIIQFEDFQNNIAELSIEEAPATPKKIKPMYQYITWVAAALLIFSSLFFYFKIPIPFNKTQTSLDVTSGSLARKTILLADGSIVTLRKNSQLVISADFNKDTREVWLSGEAFFDVHHNQSKPFIVHAAENNIRVLGTIFNVKAYPDSSYSETSLLEGMVRVTSNTDPKLSVILKPNYKFISSASNQSKTKETTNPSLPAYNVVNMMGKNQKGDEVKWVRTRMDIEDESLLQIANRLEKWYGIEIAFGDKEVEKYRYSGIFENENVVKSLEALQLSYHFNFKIEGDKILISK